MLRFVVRRVLVAVPLLVAASILSFALTTAMGDPLGEWKVQRPRTEQGPETRSLAHPSSLSPLSRGFRARNEPGDESARARTESARES